jgi:autotransporter-associated beta strand protein
MTVEQGSLASEAGIGTFNWSAHTDNNILNDSHDLLVSFALKKIEIFRGRTLEVDLFDTDPTRDFQIELTDYIYVPGDDTLFGKVPGYYSGSAGSGNVLFADFTSTGTGIRILTANSFTGTTFVAADTALYLTNSHALGSAARHTTLLSATDPGAKIVLSGAPASTAPNSAHVGALQITNGAQIDFGHAGSLIITPNDPSLGLAQGVTATAPGTSHVTGPNALTGTGNLTTLHGNLIITDSNTTLLLTTTIAPTATITLQHVAALNTGTIHNQGLLIFDTVAATGSNQNAITGTALTIATAGANVTLVGDNTTYTGTWQIDANSAFKATGTHSLGRSPSITIAHTGTLRLGSAGVSPADWTLHPTNIITGTGQLQKTDDNLVTISHPNPNFTGNTHITAGVLQLTSTLAIGTGTAHLASLLDLSFTGPYANDTTGTGTASVGRAGSPSQPSAINITGNTTNFQGQWHLLPASSATMTTQQNLGSTLSGLAASATIAQTASLFLNGMSASGSFVLSNTISGAGLLDITLHNPTDLFLLNPVAPQPFTAAFQGTANFHASTYTLQNNDFSLATIVSSPASTIHIATGSNPVDAYHFAGGLTTGDAQNLRLRFDPTYVQMAADGKL